MFKENFVIKGELVCETGLHIGGANDAINIGGADSIIIRDSVSDLPFIPGSSLKGKLRSLLELNDKKSIQSVLEKKGKSSTDEDSIAVKIFGISSDKKNNLKYPTRLIVRDSFPTEESIKLWEKQEEVVRGSELKWENTIDRITSRANPRSLERIPKGSSFIFEFIFSVYEEDENNLMGLFEAMRLLEDNYLGGSGSRGYGKVKFANISITKRGQDYYKKDMDEEVIIENADISEAVKSIN
ncbi:type III-A CRISPR-associated RAMP protein Csm3 [Methanobrevibacter smithii]|uniref:type III-A CRISPR-associated RAMP protein Csm3 n=1 Tax=uncultured Methanobrevibacter sp. TaxID=253161 RepID=UPI00259810DC|nr:type III-A CRISPR-associated RAMP protein Csm3 [Methanobrevibacter smithii]